MLKTTILLQMFGINDIFGSNKVLATNEIDGINYVFGGNKVLATNEIDGIEGSNGLIEKFVKPKN